MQMPVSLYQDPTRCPELCPGGVNLSIYEQVHNASLFSLYLPIANEADTKWAETGRNYTDLEFYHTLLMTNHMEQDKDTFADGIRGRTLWHNEYRSQVMYAHPEQFQPFALPGRHVPGGLYRRDGQGTLS